MYTFTVKRYINNFPRTIHLRASYQVYPFIPGKYSGPPEDCFPDEGGYVELTGSIECYKNGCWQKWDDKLTLEEYDDIVERIYKEVIDNDCEMGYE